MRVRKQDTSGDMVFGGGSAAFWIDNKFGVGQIVGTRLQLWQGQWFLNVFDGTPWNTKILGKYTGKTMDPAIQARILTTPGVKQIDSYSSSLNRDTRVWTVGAEVETVYGPIAIQGPL